MEFFIRSNKLSGLWSFSFLSTSFFIVEIWVTWENIHHSKLRKTKTKSWWYPKPQCPSFLQLNNLRTIKRVISLKKYSTNIITFDSQLIRPPTHCYDASLLLNWMIFIRFSFFLLADCITICEIKSQLLNFQSSDMFTLVCWWILIPTKKHMYK